MLAQAMDTELANQVIGKLPLLASAVLDFNPDLKIMIDDIETASNNDTRIDLFNKINQLLPESLQWSICPVSSVTDSFIVLSEHALCEITGLDIQSFQHKGDLIVGKCLTELR